MQVRSRVGVGSSTVCWPAAQMVTGEQRGPSIDDPLHWPWRYSTCMRLGMLTEAAAAATDDKLAVVVVVG